MRKLAICIMVLSVVVSLPITFFGEEPVKYTQKTKSSHKTGLPKNVIFYKNYIFMVLISLETSCLPRTKIVSKCLNTTIIFKE